MEAQAKPKRQDPPGAAVSRGPVVLPVGTPNEDADSDTAGELQATTTSASKETNKAGHVPTPLSTSPASTPTPSARAIEFLWDESHDFLEPEYRISKDPGNHEATVPLRWASGLRDGQGFSIRPEICEYHNGAERNCRAAWKRSGRLTARQEGSPFDEVSFTLLNDTPYFLRLTWEETEGDVAVGSIGVSYSWLFARYKGTDAEMEINQFLQDFQSGSFLPYMDETGVMKQGNIFDGFEAIPSPLSQIMASAAATTEDKQAKPTGSDVTLSPTSTLTDDIRDGKGGRETSSPSNVADNNDANPAGRGLSTGAIAGIGVAAGIVALAIVGFLVWFFCLRNRRRRSAKDHLRDGPYTAPADAQASEFMVSKETNGAHITESPHSPYSDDGSLANPQAAAAAYAQQQQQQQQHHQYQPQQQPPQEQYSDAPPIAAPVPRSGSRQAAAAAEDRPVSRSGARSGTPGGNVSHLIEEGMTEADIRRLEEEERALDDAIERAGHGRRT